MKRLIPIFKTGRVILLLVFVLFALIAIHPSLEVEGVTIRSVSPNSSAANAGLQNPSPKEPPLARERILSVNGKPVSSVEEFYQQTSSFVINETIRLTTDRQTYTLIASGADQGIIVYDAPSTNLRKGLDLEGGTRVLLEPAEPLSSEDVDITIDSLTERLNVYGLSDVVVRPASDLEGSDFILIEMAGVTEQEVKDLLARQGKFEARIGNETVFLGGKKDITYVCRSADCSGLDPQRGCSPLAEGYACSFFFAITLSPGAAERHAEATKSLSIIDGNYLSEELVLFLDDVEVDRLNIGAELKGRAATNIQISGAGIGRSQQEAVDTALQDMKKLQTIIMTGSLPVKLNIVKLDTISPLLGQAFLSNVLRVGVLALIAVAAIVLLRYRNVKIVMPMVLTIVAEVILILGFAALVGWNLDLAALAGIIIVVGTGVDHLIVITDEAIKGEMISDWKRKIKNAMFIVVGAYLTTVAGMIPLWFAGAGLLRGFAFTTIAGISFGVLIARPAYAAVIEKLL